MKLAGHCTVLAIYLLHNLLTFVTSTDGGCCLDDRRVLTGVSGLCAQLAVT